MINKKKNTDSSSVSLSNIKNKYHFLPLISVKTNREKEFSLFFLFPSPSISVKIKAKEEDDDDLWLSSEQQPFVSSSCPLISQPLPKHPPDFGSSSFLLLIQLKTNKTPPLRLHCSSWRRAVFLLSFLSSFGPVGNRRCSSHPTTNLPITGGAWIANSCQQKFKRPCLPFCCANFDLPRSCSTSAGNEKRESGRDRRRSIPLPLLAASPRNHSRLAGPPFLPFGLVDPGDVTSELQTIGTHRTTQPLHAFLLTSSFGYHRVSLSPRRMSLPSARSNEWRGKSPNLF